LTKYTETEIRNMFIETAKFFDLIHAHVRSVYNAAYWEFPDDAIDVDQMTVVVVKDGERHDTTVTLDDLVAAQESDL
jgi:hypothetical protein